jgi:septum site-determining protein MinC
VAVKISIRFILQSLVAQFFDIKSTQLPCMTLVIKTLDLQSVMGELDQNFGSQGETPGFFDNDVVVIDFLNAELETSVSQLQALLHTLQCCHLRPVAFRSAHTEVAKIMSGLGLLPTAAEPVRLKTSSSINTISTKPLEIIKEVVKEVIREVPPPDALVINRPLRSGQKVYARGTDLIVLSVVNSGAEAVADGNIHVYAPLRGKAIAGASGNTKSRIFSLSMDPELVSIAGIYHTTDHPLKDDIKGKPAQVYLSHDGQDNLLFEAMNL